MNKYISKCQFDIKLRGAFTVDLNADIEPFSDGWKNRLFIEYLQLMARRQRLEEANKIVNNNPLLERQLKVMKEYSEILYERMMNEPEMLEYFRKRGFI